MRLPVATRTAAPLLAAVAVLGLLAGCGSGPPQPGRLDPGPIKLGLAVPLSGPNATVGSSVELGAEIAASQLNAGGGILGRKVRIVTEDTTSDLTQSVQVVRKLVLDDRVDLLVGPTSSDQVSAVVDTIAAVHLPDVQGSASPDFGPQSMPSAFSITASANDQGLAMVGYAASKQYHDIAILSDTQQYGNLGAQAITGAARQRGMTIDSAAKYPEGTADMTAQVLGLKNAHPQALMIFASNGQDTGRALQAIQALHWDVPIIGNYGTTFTGPAEAIAGPDAYAHVTALEYPGFGACSRAAVPPETVKFLAQLKAFDPAHAATTQSDLAANTHDAVLLLAAGANGSHSIDGNTVAKWVEAHASGLTAGYVNAPFGITAGSHFLTSHNALVAVAPGSVVVPGVFQKQTGCAGV
jgi:branched-chain amino acid transport system substrate-binding protein